MKRARKKKVHHRRKRSIGAVKGAGKAVATIAGGVIGQFAYNSIKTMNVVPAKITGAVPLVLGMLLQKGKTETMKSLGTGLMVIGGVNLVKDNAGGALGAVIAGRGNLVTAQQRAQALPASVNGHRRRPVAGIVAGMSAREASILSA